MYIMSRSQSLQQTQRRQMTSGQMTDRRDQLRQRIATRQQQQQQFQTRSAGANRIPQRAFVQSQRTGIISNIDSHNRRSTQARITSGLPRLSISPLPRQPSISVSQISRRRLSSQGIQSLRPDQQTKRVPTNILRQSSVVSSNRNLPRVVSRVKPKKISQENPLIVSTVQEPQGVNTVDLQPIIGTHQQFTNLVPQTQQQTSASHQQTQVIVPESQPVHTVALQKQQQTPVIATKGQPVLIATPEIKQLTLQGNQVTGNIAVQQATTAQGNTALLQGVGQNVLPVDVPNAQQSTVQYIPVAGSAAVQTPGTNPSSVGSSDIVFEELVNAFTAVLENPTGQQTPAVQTNPIVHNMHAQTALQSTIQIHPQSQGVLQHGGIVQSQPGIVQHGVMQHGGFVQPMTSLHNGMFGGHMHGHQFGFMNPWMMGGMDSAMMQEMMFGDTTDPPDPVATTTTAAPTVAAAPDLSVNNTSPILAMVNTSAVSQASDQHVNVSAKGVVDLTSKPLSAGTSITVTQPKIVTPVKTSVDIVKVAKQKMPVVADVLNADVTLVSNVIPERVNVMTVPGAIQGQVETNIQQGELAPVATKADISVKPDVVPNTVSVMTVPDGVQSPVQTDIHQKEHTPIVADAQTDIGIKPTLQPAITKASMTLEEKLMAEVKAMLANTQVDMSMISQVVGQVANELSGAAVEHLPSASQLGLETLVPDPSAKKLSKKEIVSELIGSTRGVVVYPPTPPSVNVELRAKEVQANVILKNKQMPNFVQNDTSTGLMSEKLILKEKKMPHITPAVSATTKLPPHVDIPTLPPKTGHMDQSPEVYRTLQTILDHNPSALVKVLDNTAVPITPGPKISVKSLVDIDPQSNLPNLQSILTDISTANKTNISYNTSNTPQLRKTETRFEPIVNTLNGGNKENSSSMSDLPKMNDMKVQPLMDGASLIKGNDITYEAFSSNLPTMPFLPAKNADTTDSAPPTDTVAPTDAAAPTDTIPLAETQVPTTPGPIFNGSEEASSTTDQTWSFSTVSPFVNAETTTDVSKSATTANAEGVPVNVSEHVNTNAPKLANMEGVPVHMERIPTTEHSPEKLDATGALSILQEIKSFGPNSSSSKHDAIANKLSDPDYVNMLRDLLKAMMGKASVTTTPAPLWTDAQEFSTTSFPVSTTNLPISSTEEYEAEDFITETPAP